MIDWHTEAIRYDGVWVLKDEAEAKIEAAMEQAECPPDVPASSPEQT